MKKRIFMLLLTVTVLLGALTLTVSAAESGTCGENLTWTLNSEGTLTISGTGAMENYAWKEAPWYSLRADILSVVVENGVTTISDYAFDDSNNLNSITLSDSVTTIGYDAFSSCESLDGIWVEDGNPNYSSDDRGVLFNKAKTELIQAPSKISGAYSVPESVTTIGDYAFYDCSNLNSITLSDSVTTIGYDAFSSCESLDGIWVEDGNPNYSSDDRGVLFNKAKTELIQAPNNIFGAYSVPESVTSIGERAFYDCFSLSSVTIPDSVTSIGNYAFSRCDSLSNITIPEGITSIDTGVFCYCGSLNSITLPDSITSIGDRAFQGCQNLSSITIPEGVTSIGDWAFALCESLSSITIPAGITSIGVSMFSSCFDLTSITIPDSVTYIDYNAFCYCSDLTSITIPEGVTSIDDSAFAYCSSLSSIAIPESIFEITESAFYHCNNLSTVHYAGTEEQRANIYISATENTNLTDATWHYECDGSDIAPPETPPTEPEVTEPEATEPEATEPEATKPAENPFADITTDAYYFTPVLWAVEKGVTTGVSETSFAPDSTCTRAQIVTFLWRANGSPAPSSANNPFTDVPAGQWYTDAVLWAVEKGITSGTSATTFSPDAGCTRGQVATFLWRAEGEPASGAENIFTDIAPGAYYYNAVLWAVEQDITNGVGEGLFAPDATCTRGQIVTFLYRAMV